MGPSGCGKSTLLHLIGGLDRPSGGELWLGDRRIDRCSERALARLRRHDIVFVFVFVFVFQAFHLMDELTAQENVELPALLAATWILLPNGAANRFHEAYRPAPDAATLRRARDWAIGRAISGILIGDVGDHGRPGGKPTWGRPPAPHSGASPQRLTRKSDGRVPRRLVSFAGEH